MGSKSLSSIISTYLSLQYIYKLYFPTDPGSLQHNNSENV